MHTATSMASLGHMCANCLRRLDADDGEGRDLCPTCWRELRLASTVRPHLRDRLLRDVPSGPSQSLDVVSIPETTVERVAPADSEAPWAADRASRVLVVEDRKYLRDTTAAILSGEGYLVVGAGDGVEALEKLRRRDIDVMLLDLQLPRKNGETVLEELPGPLAVVICSAFEDWDEAYIPRRFGSTVVECLQKPVPPKRLLAATAAAAAQCRTLAG